MLIHSKINHRNDAVTSGDEAWNQRIVVNESQKDSS